MSRPRRGRSPSGSPQLVDLWWEEARKYQVLPLDNRPIAALLAPRKPVRRARPRTSSIPVGVADPGERDRERRATATTRSPRRSRSPTVGTAGGCPARDGDAARWLVASICSTAGCGTCTATWARTGTPSRPTSSCRPARTSSASRSRATATSAASAGCSSTATVVGEGEIPITTPVRYSITGAGLTCGWEQGPPVGDGYAAPFRFTGTLHRVVVDVSTASGTGTRRPSSRRSWRSSSPRGHTGRP